MRGLTSDDFSQLSLFGKIKDYLWHIVLPVTALTLGAFATTTFLTKNAFIDEIRKQYVITARMKGLTERRVLYGHVFRNAMLIVISGFPGAFISAFFTGALLIETIFSLDGLGLLSFESTLNRDYPVVFANLYIFALLGLVDQSALRSHLCLDRSAHRFRNAGDLMLPLSPITRRRLDAFKRNRRGFYAFWIFLFAFFASLGAEFIANDKPILASYKGELLFPAFVDYPEEKFGGFLAETDYRDPVIFKEIEAHGWMIWPPIRYSYDTHNLAPAAARPLAADLEPDQRAMRPRQDF